MLQKTSGQGQLPFVHKTAETSKQALESVIKKRSARMLAVENHLLMAGAAGLTRHELAAKMNIPLSSVCSLVSKMLFSNTVAESGDTRPSPHGRAANVVRLARFAETQRGHSDG